MPNNNPEGIKKLNEVYENGLFSLAMDNLAREDGEISLEENRLLKTDPQNLPSPESMKRFTKLLDAHLRNLKKSQKDSHILKLSKRSAVALMAVIILFSVMIAGVQALRVQVLNFLISIEPKYTSLQLNDNGNTHGTEQLIVNWANTYVPTYMPDGYEVSSITYTDSIKKLIFENSGDTSLIIYTEYDSTNTIAVDTEGASLIEKVNINGHNGTLSIKDSVTSVAWTIDNHLFSIQGQINKVQAIKIAEGVKFIK